MIQPTIPSALYHCTVAHVRHGGPEHRLRYRVAYLLINIDEAPSLDRRLKLFGYDRPRPFSLLKRDHGRRDSGDLRAWAERELADAGLAKFTAQLYLLCMPRMLGYAFNPLSVWYCADEHGVFGAVIYEVHNTFGGRHAYVLPVSPETERRHGGRRFARHEADKEFYVSPFLDMAARYDFQLTAPEETLALTIRQFKGRTKVLTASMSGQRAALTDRALLALFLRYPFMTLKVTFGIHWEAVKLWAKGARIRSRKTLPPVKRAGRLASPADSDTAERHGQRL